MHHYYYFSVAWRLSVCWPTCCTLRRADLDLYSVLVVELKTRVDLDLDLLVLDLDLDLAFSDSESDLLFSLDDDLDLDLCRVLWYFWLGVNLPIEEPPCLLRGILDLDLPRSRFFANFEQHQPFGRVCQSVGFGHKSYGLRHRKVCESPFSMPCIVDFRLALKSLATGLWADKGYSNEETIKFQTKKLQRLHTSFYRCASYHYRLGILQNLKSFGSVVQKPFASEI